MVDYDKIAAFFTADPWVPSNRTDAADSPVGSLIGVGASGGEPIYSCKLHPKIRSVHIESIEHHIRYSETEVHWYAVENQKVE